MTLDFLKNQYEKVCLGVALLALLGWCAFLVFSISKAREDIESLRPPPDTAAVKPVPALDPAKDLPGLQVLADDNTQWVRRTSIFDPPGYLWCVRADCGHLLPADCVKCPYCGTEQPGIGGNENSTDDSDKDGIPDAIEKAYAFLDSTNPRDAALDQDDDGFTNLEEHKAGTKMDDASSHPPYAEKLYFVQADQTLLPLRLERISREGRTPADWVLQFSVVEGAKMVTRFAKIGQSVSGFKVVGVASKITKVYQSATKSFLEKDESAVTVQRGSEEPILVRPGVAAYEPGVKVRFAVVRNPFEWNKYQFIDTRVEEEFEVKIGMGAVERYKVLAAGNGEAKVQVIEGGKPGRTFTIVRFRPPAEAAPVSRPSVPGVGVPPTVLPGVSVPAIPALPGPVVPAVPAVPQAPQGEVVWPSI